MRYLPHTPEEIEVMLAVSGYGSLEEMFATIPAELKRQQPMALPMPKSEWELTEHIREVAEMMQLTAKSKVLVGAGSYDHFIPETVKHLAGRSEFLTAYTPYQPEMAQGTLQAIYEYQTLTSRLLGMEVANASIYDGASALAESLLMALRLGKKKNKVAVSKAIHPHYREVVKTYLQATSFEIIELDYDEKGRTDLSTLGSEDFKELAAIAVQSPNFFGVIEDLKHCAETAHDNKVLFVTCFSEALAYGLYTSPGSAGADIVCGEGQSMGISRSFGGAGLGMFACRQKHVRNMPGRVVGQTKDVRGNRGFVLTLNTREQHIRREKATSNICSNQGICALTAGMYMASLGGTGLRDLARLNYDKAEYFKKGLVAAGAEEVFASPTFNEFVLKMPEGFEVARAKLLKDNIVAGIELQRYHEELAGCYLFCATETVTKKVLDQVVSEVQNG